MDIGFGTRTTVRYLSFDLRRLVNDQTLSRIIKREKISVIRIFKIMCLLREDEAQELY